MFMKEADDDDMCVCVCVSTTMGGHVKIKGTMVMEENMNPMYVPVSGSDAAQPAICPQINPGCA